MIRHANIFRSLPCLAVWMLCLLWGPAVAVGAGAEPRGGRGVFVLVKDGRTRARVVVQAEASRRLERGVDDLVTYI